jgi:cytochrome c peroxidase
MRLRLNNQILTSCALLLCGSVHAAPLVLELVPVFGDKPIQLNSLKYGAEEKISVSRFSMLLCDFMLQAEDGTWHASATESAYIDLASQRLSVDLGDLPEHPIRALRFAVGPNAESNHADPAQYAADHPLNPVLNHLLWDWQSGYIFMAMEGRFQTKDHPLSGYVLHYANDWNRQWIHIPVKLSGVNPTALELHFDIESLLNTAAPISFIRDGHITHSREDDILSGKLKTNLLTAFRLNAVSVFTKTSKPTEQPSPLYLPETYEAYPFKMSRTFSRPALPTDNPLTQARVELGEHLFNETLLSSDGSLSCASCHKSEHAFSDPNAVSAGVANAQGHRNSMPLFNLAWKTEFFWDGRAPSLREQVLEPITNHVELAADLDTVVEQLGTHADYTERFARAFDPPEITTEKMALALEAYLLTLTSHNARFDQAQRGEVELTPEEQRGMELFFTEYDPRTRQYGGDCFHCHGGSLFTDQQFHNNGIEPTDDIGRAIVTGKESDRFLFATPSLRNVEITGPYMHDGRFQTLEEVIDHYTHPITPSATLDPNLAKHPQTGLQLSEQDKAALVSFLKTLTDSAYSKGLKSR